MEQIILPKNIFLPHFEIVQNFHYFLRSAPVDFLSKIQFSEKCLKCCRNVFFWWVEQIILPKNIFLPHFEIVQNFNYFVRSAPIDFLSKIQFSKKCLKCCRNVSFDEWFLQHLRQFLENWIFDGKSTGATLTK